GRILKAAALGLGVFALAWLSISLTSRASRIAAIWPVSAVVLVCLLRTHVRRSPALLASAFLGNVAADLACSQALFTALGLCLTSSFGTVLCAAGLRRTVGRRVDFRRRRDLWLFAGLCGVLAPLITGTLATMILGRSMLGLPAVRAWVNWVLSD